MGKIEYKRGRKDRTYMADRMTWESRCGQFRVQQSLNLYDGVTRYYALRLLGSVWSMVCHMKTYRTRKAAEKALETPVKSKKSSGRRRSGRKRI